MPKIDFWRKKGRKYPIKRDETGKSARQRCFKLFEEEAPLQLIAEGEDVPIKAVYKYHRQWLKDPHITKHLAYLKTMFPRENPNRDKSINQLALVLGIESEKAEALLASLYGLQRLLTFKAVFPGHEREYYNRYMSLTLGILLADHLITNNGRFEHIYYAFEQLMKRYRQDRRQKLRNMTKS